MFAIFAVISITGCTTPIQAPPQTPRPVTIKPEINYSDSIPDCETAGLRISENVTAGLPVYEVIRLVGKPAYRFPGSWWWSSGFSKTGKPYIQYDAIGSTVADGVVTKFSADTSKC